MNLRWIIGGIIYYKIIKSKDRNFLLVTDIKVDVDNFYNWIYNHIYPNKSNIPKPLRYFKKKVKPIFGYFVIKVWGKEKYNLLNNKGEIVLPEWVDKIKPLKVKEPYGTYKLIAHCNHRGFISGISVDGKLYDTERSWNSAYNESYINNKLLQYLITEAVNNVEIDKKYQQIIQNYYNSWHNLLL